MSPTSEEELRAEIERLERELKLARLEARTDYLTTIGNQRKFDEDLRSDEERILVAFDVNRFKRYNDAYGHLRGNEFLKAFAAHLQQHFPDQCYRLGGGADEFVVILPHISEHEAESQARDAIASFYPEEVDGAVIDASFGLGFTFEDADENLMRYGKEEARETESLTKGWASHPENPTA